ncbi:MAG: hypothetical protein IJI45_12775 [Anaerolineaceae bacterium]|nr:hypothetical protein [Anaerolineaceae bacterium]
MKIGATEQEVQESKKQALKEPERRFQSRSESNGIDKAIYYFSDGKVPNSSKYPENIYVPIENYSAMLIKQLDLYLNRISRSLDVDNVEVLIALRSVIFPNNKEFQILRPSQSPAVWEMVQRYTRCIMRHVGDLAECVLVDHCANNPIVNRVCMNIALFKDEILETYEIPYDEYVAYSTSFIYMVYKDPKDGIYKIRENHYYNPNHTSMDIGWCKRDNIWEQLRAEMVELKYVDNAKLQVKTTLDCSNLDLEDYILTPVVVFDFDHGIAKLRERYPHHSIYSGYELFPEMAIQMEKYFQIIAAYVCGLTNKLNITETDLKNDKRLQILFKTSVYEITKKKRDLDRMGLIKLAEDAGKPVLIRA